MYKFLFGTHNPSKIERMKAIVKNLPIEIVGLKDFCIMEEAIEDGNNVVENAVKKAAFYFRKTNIPTFSMDTGLYIDKFSDENQPGLFVRRLHGKKATDEELLNYYIRKLKKVGGESKGKWISAIAFVWDGDHVAHYELVEERYFVAEPSPIIKKGMPLSSLAIDPMINKYISEITEGERGQLQVRADQKLYQFFEDMLERISVAKSNV